MMKTAYRQSGSILPVLLVILAVISLLIAGISQLAEQQIVELQQKQKTLIALEEWHNTREILFYALLTRPFNESGMVTDLNVTRPDDPYAPLPPNTGTELRVDNTLYRGWGETVFALQDANGLININRMTPEQLAGLLDWHGITEPEQHQLYYDTLRDYIDQDDLRRPSGAEKAAYADEDGLSPPPNRGISSLSELNHILNWREDDSPHNDPDFYDQLSPTGQNLFNVNTAPAAVIAAHAALDRNTTQELINNRPYEYEGEVYEITGTDIPVPVERIFYIAARYFRLRLYHPDLNYYEELFITHSVKEQDGHPWIIESALRFPADRAPDLAAARETGLSYFTPAYLGIAEPEE